MSDTTSWDKRALGLVTGVGFGVLLQRAKVGRFEVIQDMLLLREGRVAKVMATAVAVGATTVQALRRRGMAKPDIKPMQVGGVVAGSILFGTGLALMGYCPGTSLAAVGEGRRDAIPGVLGMLAGAALFVAVLPKLKGFIEAGNLGKTTLPGLTKTSAAPWVAALDGLVGAGAAIAALVHRPR